MAISDPIADMLTRIRNAVKAKHFFVYIPGSKLKIEIAMVLKKEGYISRYEIIENNKQGFLKVYIKNKVSGKIGIISIDRVSKPSRRVYKRVKEIKKVRNGMGIAILSTSLGVITDKEAVKKNVGGEIICTVW